MSDLLTIVHHYFFLYMIPQKRRSTLFPYTTLFRSRAERGGGPDPERRRARAGQARAEEDGQDRKSTRLNSSHEWISYAVFCLKKKKRILADRCRPREGRRGMW